jgi:hypothetical protein
VRHALFRQRLRHGPASRVTPHRQQRDHFSAQAMKSQPEIQSFAAVFLEYPLRHQRFVETFYEVMRRQGITRRSFLKYCSLTATSLGLGPAFVPQIAHAMETKPRTPVLWLHGLECTCCTEASSAARTRWPRTWCCR